MYLLLPILILLSFFFSLFLYAANALCGLYAPNEMNQDSAVLFRSNQMVTQTIKECQEKSKPI